MTDSRPPEKNIDMELLFFYMGISVLSFGIYLFKHPLPVFIFNEKNVSRVALLSAYLLDLFIFLSVFIPYLASVITLLIIKLVKDIKIPDPLFVILFFPILSFFIKGMSLLQIYLNPGLFEIIRDNIAFFSFIFLGPALILFNKILIHYHLKSNKKDNSVE